MALHTRLRDVLERRESRVTFDEQVTDRFGRDQHRQVSATPLHDRHGAVLAIADTPVAADGSVAD